MWLWVEEKRGRRERERRGLLGRETEWSERDGKYETKPIAIHIPFPCLSVSGKFGFDLGVGGLNEDFFSSSTSSISMPTAEAEGEGEGREGASASILPVGISRSTSIPSNGGAPSPDAGSFIPIVRRLRI